MIVPSITYISKNGIECGVVKHKRVSPVKWKMTLPQGQSKAERPPSRCEIKFSQMMPFIPAGTALVDCWETAHFLIDRDGSLCAYCGTRKRGQVEHVHPKSKGGTDDLDNLVLACRDCNRKKANLTLLQWLHGGALA